MARAAVHALVPDGAAARAGRVPRRGVLPHRPPRRLGRALDDRRVRARARRRASALLGPNVPPAAKANGASKANGNGHGNGHVANGQTPKSERRELKEVNRRVVRLAEQGWMLLYYLYQWSMGLVRACDVFVIPPPLTDPGQYVYQHLPVKMFDTDGLWLGYPHIPLPGPVKFYYLSQTAFYTHGMLVLNAEAHRKDHVQMMTHHVVTVVLMVCSYAYNFTRVGCVIMVLMDWCDIWLPVRAPPPLHARVAPLTRRARSSRRCSGMRRTRPRATSRRRRSSCSGSSPATSSSAA
jgi:hypothetical protein